MEMVDVVNDHMKSQHLGHHITQVQALQLQEVFGDMEMLLDLAGMEDNSLYTILRYDSKLKAVQIFRLQSVLRTIIAQDTSHQEL